MKTTKEDKPLKFEFKLYKCSECGHEQEIQTNHFGECYSFGRYNVCPKCPPYKKYAEFGGATIWLCIATPPKGAFIPEPWTKTTIKVKKVKK